MKNCAPQPGCKPVESKCVLYSGSYLENLEIFAGTNLDIILKKVNDLISNSGSQNLELTGDIIASGTLGSPIVTTLNSSGVISGTYGSSSIIPVFSVDYKGRITNVSPVPLTYTETDPIFLSQKGQVNGVATLDSNGFVPLSQLPPLGTGTVTSVGITSSDLTISGSPITTSGVISIVLPNIVAPNTFNNIQFNAKGQVIGGFNIAYLTSETDPVYNAQKGQPNGAATLTASGKLTTSQFPNIQDTASIDITYNTTTNTLSADVLGYTPANWNTAYNKTVTGLSFNVANGDLTISQQDGSGITENLDFRYILESEAGNFIQNQDTIEQPADFSIGGSGYIATDFEVDGTTTLNDLIVEGNATILSTITVGSPSKGTIAPNADSMDYVAGIGFDAQFGSGGRNNDMIIANATGITTFSQTPRVNSNIIWHNGNFPLSISSPTNGQYLTFNGTSWVNTTTSFITSLAHNHFVANSAGTNQFGFGVNEAVRFVGAGDTTVSFNAGTKTVTITSIPGSGGGGAVTSFNGRTGGVVSAEGDYNLTDLGDVTITTPVTNQLLQYNGSNWINFTPTYISGNQTITLSSDITGSGTTSISAIIANNAVTYAKMQDITAIKLLGRYSATNGDPQEIQIGSGINLNTSTGVLSATGTGGTVTSVALSLPSIFNVSGSPVTNTGTLTGSLAVQSANTVFAGPTNGVVTTPTFRTLVTADIPSLDTAKITSGIFPIIRGGTGLSTIGTANQLIRVNAGATALEYFTPSYLTGNQSITLSGDVTGTGTTAITTTIGNATVTYAKIQNVTSSRLLGRFAATNGSTQEIQLGTGLTLNNTTGVLSATVSGGTVTSVGISSTDFSISGSPIITSGNITLNLNNNSVTYAKMQDVTGGRIIGRFAASAGDPQEISIGTGLSLNTTTGILANSSPDQTVTLTNGTGISITGTYPNFTVTNTAPNTIPNLSQVLTVGNTGGISDITLGLTGNTNFTGYRNIRNVSSVNYNTNLGISTIPELTLSISNGTGAQNKLLLIPFSGTSLQYSPNNGTNKYDVWHSNNHPAGIANNSALTGAQVYSNIVTNSAGHISQAPTVRTLSAGDISAVGNTSLSADWNSYNGSAIGAFTFGSVNAPTVSNYFGINIPGNLGNIGAQVAFRNNAGYFRTLESGVYGSWLQFADRTFTAATYAPISGSVNYIQNQFSAAQTANSWISGIYRGGSFESLSAPNTAGLSLKNASNSLRWIIRGETAESGANSGFDFVILRRDDAGGSLGTALSITRANGLLTVPGSANIGGNVGVGTTSPAFKLDVSGTAGVSTSLTTPAIISPATDDLTLTATGSHYMVFNTNGTEKMRLSADGRLGIGIVPNSIRASLLEVEGNIWSSDAYILGVGNAPTAEFGLSGSGTNGNAFMRMMGTGNLNLQTSANQTRLHINGTTGNIGIGTTSPSSQLTVAGTASFGAGLATFDSFGQLSAPNVQVSNIMSAGSVATDDFTLTDGTQGVGKVLTSDGSGHATWQSAPNPLQTYIQVENGSYSEFSASWGNIVRVNPTSNGAITILANYPGYANKIAYVYNPTNFTYVLGGASISAKMMVLFWGPTGSISATLPIS